MDQSHFYPHVSVDCVVFGFDGQQLKILLVTRTGVEKEGLYSDMKLPGSVIYEHENLDEAAYRVLFELTGIKDIYLQQFHSFGAPQRTQNQRDIIWLENALQMKIGRIVTVGYVALLKIGQKLRKFAAGFEANWYGLDEIGHLAFDHNEIVEQALNYIRKQIAEDPDGMFELLPKKFTEAELRNLHEVIFGEKIDVRNFHKKFCAMSYIVALTEKEPQAAHRAARLYRFDKMLYNKTLPPTSLQRRGKNLPHAPNHALADLQM